MGLSLRELPLPIRIVPATPVTDEELTAFSNDNSGFRIEKNAQGEIVVMTSAGQRGDGRELDFAAELIVWARRDKRGEANGANAGWNLPDGSTKSPDASWTSSESLAHFTSEERERFLPICPEFIAEIRSHSVSISVFQEKMELWMANGAQLGWLIDPYAATVSIYRPGYPPEVLQKPEVVEGEGPIAGFRIDMERFWA